jgi:hypothetical protein
MLSRRSQEGHQSLARITDQITVVPSICNNQLQHYLCLQPITITAQGGKQIELKNAKNGKPLVDHQDFCKTIANAVRQTELWKRMVLQPMLCLLEWLSPVAKWLRKPLW